LGPTLETCGRGADRELIADRLAREVEALTEDALLDDLAIFVEVIHTDVGELVRPEHEERRAGSVEDHHRILAVGDPRGARYRRVIQVGDELELGADPAGTADSAPPEAEVGVRPDDDRLTVGRDRRGGRALIVMISALDHHLRPGRQSRGGQWVGAEDA
jgi:hypothetical protein